MNNYQSSRRTSRRVPGTRFTTRGPEPRAEPDVTLNATCPVCGNGYPRTSDAHDCEASHSTPTGRVWPDDTTSTARKVTGL